jgi:hypothetical protein
MRSPNGGALWVLTDTGQWQTVVDMAYPAGDPRALTVAGLGGPPDQFATLEGPPPHWG